MRFPIDIETLSMYAAIVDQHDEVLDIWRNLDIQDALVLHIDAHSDMDDCVDADLYDEKVDDIYSSIANFLCVGSYEGIIDNLYWLNPHHDSSSKFKLQYIGSRGDVDNSLYAVLRFIDDDIGHVNWYNEKLVADSFIESNVSKLKTDVIKYLDNFILDIDLDAFCADTTPVLGKIVHNKTDRNYDGISGWRERIDDTIKLLQGLDCDPRLITIARSTHGMHEFNSWVPIYKVDEVQDYLLAGLQNLYAVPKEYRTISK